MINPSPVRKLVVSQIDAITINLLKEFWTNITSTEERLESKDSVFRTLESIVRKSKVIGQRPSYVSILSGKVEIIVK